MVPVLIVLLQALVIGCVVTCNSNKLITIRTGDATLNVKKIAAKPLQIETWLLLTACKKSLAPYSIVPSPTPCDLPFPWQTNDGRTDDNCLTDALYSTHVAVARQKRQE